MTELAPLLADLSAALDLPDTGAPPSLSAVVLVLGASLPAELEVLWTWGYAEQACHHHELRALPRAWWSIETWLSPRLAAGALRDLSTQAGFLPGLIPLSTDCDGNYTCYDTTSGRLFAWTRGAGELTPRAEGLPALFESLLTSLRAMRDQTDPFIQRVAATWHAPRAPKA